MAIPTSNTTSSTTKTVIRSFWTKMLSYMMTTTMLLALSSMVPVVSGCDISLSVEPSGANARDFYYQGDTMYFTVYVTNNNLAEETYSNVEIWGEIEHDYSVNNVEYSYFENNDACDVYSTASDLSLFSNYECIMGTLPAGTTKSIQFGIKISETNNLSASADADKIFFYVELVSYDSNSDNSDHDCADLMATSEVHVQERTNEPSTSPTVSTTPTISPISQYISPVPTIAPVTVATATAAEMKFKHKVNIGSQWSEANVGIFKYKIINIDTIDSPPYGWMIFELLPRELIFVSFTESDWRDDVTCSYDSNVHSITCVGTEPIVVDEYIHLRYRLEFPSDTVASGTSFTSLVSLSQFGYNSDNSDGITVLQKDEATLTFEAP